MAHTPAVDHVLRVRVAIVTFKSAGFISQCLDSLKAAAEELEGRAVLDIRVVDNASQDATCAVIARNYPEVQLVRSPTNDGFAVSTNRSIRDLDYDLALVINPDTAVRPGVLPQLLDDLEADARIGVIGCRLELRDGSFDHAAKRNLPRVGSSVRYLLDKLRGRQSGSDYLAISVGEHARGEVGAINGAFMLIRRSALETVGLLDEGFWMYGEDLDWCRRFIEAGWRVFYDGTVTALHLKGASSGRYRSLSLDWQFHASMIRYFRRSRSTGWAIFDPIIIAGVLTHLVVSQVRNIQARHRIGRSEDSEQDGRRFIVDALASPAQGGGMRMHAYETIEAWQRQYPSDKLIVVGPPWTRRDISSSFNTRHLIWPNDNFILRVLGEFIVIPVIAMLYRRHVLVSLSPVISPLAPRARAFSVAHDWRHLVNHHEFTRAQHLYRRQWRASLKRSNIIFAISEKTARETRAVDPTAKVLVVENGRDHPARWSVKRRQRDDHDTRLRVVTFGHKNNKRPELVIAAVAELDDGDRPLLTVLGAVGEYQTELAALAARLGVLNNVSFPGFVDELEYRQLIADADVVAFASSDEGFGLPLAEAEWFGGRALIATDSGLGEIHPAAVTVPPTPQGFAEGMRGAAVIRDPVQPPEVWSWGDVVTSLRDAVNSAGENS
ncbi:glycosyltransferase [Jatrophihabitans sp. YIM 134969]